VCGIAGRVSLDGAPASPELVATMIATIRHRGPDGESYWSDEHAQLGHARLAIIDLTAAADQPMPNEDGSLRLVYNGEIYNYVELADELRARGHVFRSRTDSEVILHAYEEWGEECLAHFNGMWAFALWDARRRRLFCARDRMGVKPFYYARRGGDLLFASEIKALLSVMPELRRPSMPWLRHLLVAGRLDDADDATAFADVRQLPAAHWLRLDERGLGVERYWAYAPGRHDYARPVETFRGLLEDSVRLRLRSDVPIGTCLSGGLDSSAIVGLTSRRVGQVHTFSAVYPGTDADESRFVHVVNAAYDAAAHLVEPRGEDLPSIFPKIAWHQDEPTAGPGLYSQWHVMARAHGQVKVLLDGQGADELLAGYHDYLPAFLSTLLDRALKLDSGSLARLLREYPRVSATAGRPLAVAMLRPFAPAPLERLHRRWLDADATVDVHPDLRAAHGNGTARLPRTLEAQLLEATTRTSLPALLHYEDRNSMAFGIEARVPFLDYRLVEFCLGLPVELKIHRGETKYLLRRALGDVLPAPVLNRRDKKGYPTPAATWLRSVAKEWSREILLDDRTRRRGILDMASVERKLAEHADGRRDWSWPIWRWLSVEHWFRQTIDDFRPAAA
jgi:asparagine synthase (glutamine-hydrolysing)